MTTNLIFNGDFSQGTTGWSGANMSVTNNVLSVKGDLATSSVSYAAPIANNQQYRLSFDLKVTTNDGSHMWYSCIEPLDNTKATIAIVTTNKVTGDTTNTTLGAAVANGDTTVTLTDGTNWSTGINTLKVGICDKLAWGYNRCTKCQSYSTRSGNVVTLKAAWSQGAYPAGTKVAEFRDGSTYYYPIYIANANLPTEWTTYTKTFNGGNAVRYSCQYFRFRTLGYQHEYQLRNLRLECVTEPEYLYLDKEDTIHATHANQMTASTFQEVGLPIRYVRNHINGSSANAYNHWNEIQIYNQVGENVALGKSVYFYSGATPGTARANTIVTDGIIDTQYLSGGDTIGIDLGFIETINRIGIWHYYSDGRTYYDNWTEVSADGTNWYRIEEASYPETAAGHFINVGYSRTTFRKNGQLITNEIYEC